MRRIDDAIAILVASELVTNAVMHGAEPITLAADWDGVCVYLHVSDGTPDTAAVKAQAPHPDHTGGRGLILVETLCRRWGADGKKVWGGTRTRPRDRLIHTAGVSPCARQSRSTCSFLVCTRHAGHTATRLPRLPPRHGRSTEDVQPLRDRDHAGRVLARGRWRRSFTFLGRRGGCCVSVKSRMAEYAAARIQIKVAGTELWHVRKQRTAGS